MTEPEGKDELKEFHDRVDRGWEYTKNVARGLLVVFVGIFAVSGVGVLYERHTKPEEQWKAWVAQHCTVRKFEEGTFSDKTCSWCELRGPIVGDKDSAREANEVTPELEARMAKAGGISVFMRGVEVCR